MSTDPALGDYIPGAPINDEAKKRNQNLPGMGGVFNVVNFHLYHYAGNNPIKYTDPDGKSQKYRIKLDDIKSDSFGRQILFHYLFGQGKDLVLSDSKWGDYMRAAPKIQNQINEQIKGIVDGLSSREGSVKVFSFSMHGETQNGEEINGYNYLHGSNASVGDLQISGIMTRNDDGSISVRYKARWNDIIDPNFDYSSDKTKAALAEKISGGQAKDYIIRIEWENKIKFDPPNQ